MAGFFFRDLQASLEVQRAGMPAPSIFYPKIKTVKSIREGDPSVRQLVPENGAEIVAWGSTSAHSASGGIRKGLQAPF